MNHWSNLTCVGSWGHPVTVQTAVVWTKAAARSGANTGMRFLCGEAEGMKGKIQKQKGKNLNDMTFSNISCDRGVLLERRFFIFFIILHSAYATDLEAWTHHSAGVPEFCKLNTSRQPNIGPTMTKNLKHKTHTRTAKIICWDLFEMLLFFFLPFLKHTTDDTLHYCITLWFCVVYSTSC